MNQVSTLWASQSLRKERWIFFHIWELEKKKNEEIKGRISRRSLVLFHIKQQMIQNINFVPNYKILRAIVQIFATNFPMYSIGVRDGKKEKEGKLNLSFVFCPTTYLAFLNVYTKTNWTASSEFGTYRLCAVSPEPPLLAHTGSEWRGTFRQKARSLAPLNVWACAVKICHDGMLKDTNSLDGAQLTNKGNAKQQYTDSLLHNTTFVSNFKILGAVVPEKSLTQISLCIS